MDQQPYTPPNPPNKHHGRHIAGVIRSSLESGDLSRLKDLGPAVGGMVKDVVKEIPGMMPPQRDAAPPAAYGQSARGPAQQARQTAVQQQQPSPWQGGARRPGGAGIPRGLFSTVFGVVGLTVFGLGALVFAGLALAQSAGFWALCIGFAGVAAASGLLLGAGLRKSGLGRILGQYYTLFQRKSVYTLEEIAAATGKEVRQVRKDIRRAKKAGLMADVRFDAGESSLIYGDDAWRYYLESEKTAQQRAAEEAERQRRMQDPATAGMEAFRNEGERTIRKIREANRAIPGEEISAKLDKLEGTCARIFRYVENHPEKLPETRKFMNYYLPTTLKLVEKYRQYDGMDYQPSNIVQTKAEIERSLDIVDNAFNNMLESLSRHDTLDVSTDIAVLEQMLEQEGLTKGKLTPESLK